MKNLSTLVVLLLLSTIVSAVEIKNLEAWNDVDKIIVDWEVSYPQNIQYFEVQATNDGLRWETVAKVKSSGYNKYQSIIPVVGIPVIAVLFLGFFRRRQAVVAIIIAFILLACSKQIETTKAVTQAQYIRIKENYKSGQHNISQVVRVLPRSSFPKSQK